MTASAATTRPSMPRKRFLVVGNPQAGFALDNRLAAVLAAARSRGLTMEMAGDLAEAIARDPATPLGARYDAVVAAGGDGTIRRLAIAAAPLGLPVGIIPVGTGNVLACEIGLASRPDAILDVLQAGPEVAFKGALANGEPFFLMAGAGFDGEVIALLSTGLKRRIGKAAYVGPVLRTLAGRAPALDIEIDGARHAASWMIATKARHYGGSFVLAPQAALTRPGLTVVLFKSTGIVARISELLALAFGGLDRLAGVEMHQAKKVVVRATAPVAVQADGDPAGATPLEIDAIGPGIRLIVPAGYASTASPSQS